MQSRAFLSHSVPWMSFGTRKRVANFSVSVSAASNARMHFRTFSASVWNGGSMLKVVRLLINCFVSLPESCDFPESDTDAVSEGVEDVEDAEVAMILMVFTLYFFLELAQSGLIWEETMR